MSVKKELARQLKHLQFGSIEITPKDEFVRMLEESIEKDIPLRVKCGVDPTSDQLHLGHTIPYYKMRQFQDLGHTGVVIIGDYTASIGDPSGKEESRPHLSHAQVKENAKTYINQLHTILREDKTEIHRQSEWFENTDLRDFLKWTSQTTLAKLLSHETFKIRFEKGFSLSLLELIYPTLQGMDSVYVKADVELGGTDQRFNVLMGRDYQREHGQRPQTIMLLPLITGTCGKFKMSKSLGNTINLTDRPSEKFGKVMSIPDHCLLEYYRHTASPSPDEFKTMENELKTEKLSYNEAKKRLASHIVSLFHGQETGIQMRKEFEAVFKKKEIPDDIPEFKFKRGSDLVSTLTTAGLLSSKSEARRMIQQNAVSLIDGKKTTRLTDGNMKMEDDMDHCVLKVGKRKFIRLL